MTASPQGEQLTKGQGKQTLPVPDLKVAETVYRSSAKELYSVCAYLLFRNSDHKRS